MLTRAQKEEQIAEFKEKFERANSFYVADYRGLDVPAVNELRSKIHVEGGGDYEYRVLKNAVLRRAVEGLDASEVKEHFNGPTVVAFSYGDSIGLAKILTDFSNAHDVFELKGGVFDGKAVTPAEIGTIANLPTLDELRGKLVGLIQAPAAQLARLMNAPAGQLARVVEARRKSLEEVG